jgi:hypothetical protein
VIGLTKGKIFTRVKIAAYIDVYQTRTLFYNSSDRFGFKINLVNPYGINNSESRQYTIVSIVFFFF